MAGESDTRARNGVRALFLCYFLYVGTQTPYLSLYLSEVGLSIAQIGLVMSLSPASRMIGPLSWGWLADRGGSRNLVQRACTVLSLLALFALAQAGGSVAWIMLACSVLFFANSGQMPISESIALEVAGRDAGRYSRMRVWGSIGFIVGVSATGPLFEWTGIGSLPWWLAGMMASVFACTWLLPSAPARPRGAPAAPLWTALADPVKLAFFVSSFLMLYAHSVFYSFFSLFLEEHGYGKGAIGVIWSVGVVAEIAMFYLQKPLFVRFAPLTLLGFSIAVAAIRFALVGVSEGSLGVIVLTQLLHAITFGVHHTATQALLQRWFEPGQQARAQAMYITIGYGFGGTIGGLGASWLWVSYSPAAAFWGAAVAAGLGCVAVWVCKRARAAQKAQVQASIESDGSGRGDQS